MRITIEHYETEVSWEDHGSTDLAVIADGLKGLLVTVGCHPVEVDRLFNTEAKWQIEKEKQDA
tara:strand:- start:225 stop:413 length:189 start_codon:yes stop_codon:yes gene_type:complete